MQRPAPSCRFLATGAGLAPRMLCSPMPRKQRSKVPSRRLGETWSRSPCRSGKTSHQATLPERNGHIALSPNMQAGITQQRILKAQGQQTSPIRCRPGIGELTPQSVDRLFEVIPPPRHGHRDVRIREVGRPMDAGLLLLRLDRSVKFEHPSLHVDDHCFDLCALAILDARSPHAIEPHNGSSPPALDLR
jgi:hypothetical protein